MKSGYVVTLVVINYLEYGKQMTYCVVWDVVQDVVTGLTGP